MCQAKVEFIYKCTFMMNHWRKCTQTGDKSLQLLNQIGNALYICLFSWHPLPLRVSFLLGRPVYFWATFVCKAKQSFWFLYLSILFFLCKQHFSLIRASKLLTVEIGSPSCVEFFTLFRESKPTEWKQGGKTASLKWYKNKDNAGATLPTTEEFPSIFY